MREPELNIITSPTAKQFISRVTEGFYDNSYIALWLFEVMGRKFDDAEKWAKSIKCEAFPQTATWSLDYWEQANSIPNGRNLPVVYRRQRILSKILERAPLNPERMRLVVEKLTGADAEVIENVAPYTFGVVIYVKDGQKVNYSETRSAIRKMKQSHHALELTVRYVLPDARVYVKTGTSNAVFKTVIEWELFYKSSAKSEIRASTGMSGAIFKTAIEHELFYESNAKTRLNVDLGITGVYRKTVLG